MSLLSIIIPVYNMEKYIKKSLDSIINQTFNDFELILIDDGSVDKSGEICDQYAEHDARILVKHTINQGAGCARNEGISIATGKYVMFQDADDWMEESLLEKVVEKIKLEQTDLVVWSIKTMIYNSYDKFIKHQEIIIADNYAYEVKGCEEIFINLMKANDLLLGAPWNKIYKLNIIKKYNIRFPVIRSREDIVFNISYYSKISSISTSSMIFSYYRNFTKRELKKIPSNYFEIASIVHTRFKDILIQWDRYKNKEKRYIDQYFLDDVFRLMSIYINEISNLSFKQKFKYIQEVSEEKYLYKVFSHIIDVKMPSSGIKEKLHNRMNRYLKNKQLKKLCLLIRIEYLASKIKNSIISSINK